MPVGRRHQQMLNRLTSVHLLMLADVRFTSHHSREPVPPTTACIPYYCPHSHTSSRSHHRSPEVMRSVIDSFSPFIAKKLDEHVEDVSAPTGISWLHPGRLWAEHRRWGYRCSHQTYQENKAQNIRKVIDWNMLVLMQTIKLYSKVLLIWTLKMVSVLKNINSIKKTFKYK